MLQKYFIAIIPPETIEQEIQKIKRDISEKYSTKGALRSPAHITLHMPFVWEENKEDDLINSLNTFTFNSSFEITLNNYACFEPRVVFIDLKPNPSLVLLQQQLVRFAKVNLHLFNQSDDLRGFHPHITVAFRDLKKPIFYKIFEEYQSKTFTKTFSCTSLFLLKFYDDKWVSLKEFSFSG